MSLFDQRLNLFEQSDVLHSSNNHGHEQIVHQNNLESHIRLPKIQLSSFSGSYENWYIHFMILSKSLYMQIKTYWPYRSFITYDLH